MWVENIPSIDNINTDKFNICSGFMCEECI